MSTPITSVEIGLHEQDRELLRRNTAATEQLFDLMNQSVWLTTQKAAARLGVSESTIRNWMEEGWLTGVQIDRVLRFRVDKLDAAFEKRGEFKATHPSLLNRATKSKRHFA